MNSDALFNFSAIQKDLQLPANDFVGKANVANRRAQENTHSRNASHAASSKNQSSKSEDKKFDDYISETKREETGKVREESSQTSAADGKAVSYTKVDDLRALVADLLAELREAGIVSAEGEALPEETEQTPEELLLSVFSDLRGLAVPEDGQKDDAGDTRSLFFTQTSLRTPKPEKVEEVLPQPVLDLISFGSQKDGLEILRQFLNREELSSVEGISPETLEELQAEVEAAIDEDQNFDSFAALNAIITKIVELTKPKADASIEGPIVLSEEAEIAPDIGHRKADRFENRYALDRFGAPLSGDADADGLDFRSALRAAQAVHTSADSGLSDALKSGVSKSVLMFVAGSEGGLYFGAGENSGFTAPAVTGGASVIPTPTLSGPSLTSPAVHAPHAAQPHPAVQTVAATIQKFGAEKQDTRITLQLDPPELGRVEVKMSVGKDHAAKVVLTIEKPETFAMLQRDAHTLERALADAGLNPDGSGLEFSLADEGYSFGHDGGHDSGSGHAGRGAAKSEDEQTVVIASAMGWSVNPATGRMQYDALV